MCQKNINAESTPYKSKKRRASRLAFFDNNVVLRIRNITPITPISPIKKC